MSTTYSLRLKWSAIEASTEIAASKARALRGRGARAGRCRGRWRCGRSTPPGTPSPRARRVAPRSASGCCAAGSPSRYSRVPTNSMESPRLGGERDAARLVAASQRARRSSSRRVEARVDEEHLARAPQTRAGGEAERVGARRPRPGGARSGHGAGASSSKRPPGGPVVPARGRPPRGSKAQPPPRRPPGPQPRRGSRRSAVGARHARSRTGHRRPGGGARRETRTRSRTRGPAAAVKSRATSRGPAATAKSRKTWRAGACRGRRSPRGARGPEQVAAAPVSRSR